MTALRRRLAGLLPKTVRSQVIGLLIVTLIGLHAVVTVIFVLTSPPPGGAGGKGDGRLATIVAMLEAADPAMRPTIVAEANRLDGLSLTLVDAFPAAAAAIDPTPSVDLAGRAVWKLPATGENTRHLVVGLPGGGFVEAVVESQPLPSALTGPVIVTGIFLLIGGTVFVVWAAFALTAPLREVADAVDGFDGSGATIARVQGPAEVQTVMDALVRMQQRIQRMLDDRTRMIAAVSHDLRTPITRLRLRAELIEDAEIRDPMLADLSHMTALTTAALAHLRDGNDGETDVLVDLTSLVETSVESFADLGANVVFDGPPRATARVRPHALRRALDNLIDNALAYAGSAVVSIRETADSVEIAVADEGPGIPAEDRERMTAPFARGDESRGQDSHTGFGLGLSIARAIAEAHRGRLELADNSPSGLIVRILLPRDAAIAAKPREG